MPGLIIDDMWLDTHCHLSAPEFAEDYGAVWNLARQAGVRGVLLPAVDLNDCEAVTRLTTELPGAFPAYGIHPFYVGEAKDEDLARLAEWLEQGRAVAVGEIGLDGMNREVDWARQERFFLAQLELARKYDLPVVLHVRRAIAAVLRGLRQIKVRGGIAHAFNGSLEEAKQFLKLGFKLGFGGTLTYPGSRRIRALATELPLEAIVLETDAPDIAPVWLPRQEKKARNTPIELPRIGKVLAELRGLAVEEIAFQTTTNACSILQMAIEEVLQTAMKNRFSV